MAHTIDLPLGLLQDFRIDGDSEEERLYERYRLVHAHISVLNRWRGTIALAVSVPATDRVQTQAFTIGSVKLTSISCRKSRSDHVFHVSLIS